MPQPRAEAITNALKELERMEARRGATTMLDERRLHKLLGAFDQSFECQTAHSAIMAHWERDFEGFDAAISRLLEAERLDRPEAIYVNFALTSLHALAPELSVKLNKKAFEANSTDPELLQHILCNAWDAADLETYQASLIQLGKLNANNYDALESTYRSALKVLRRHQVTTDRYQRHIQGVCDLIRPFIAGQPEVRICTGIDLERYDDDNQEILFEIDIELENEQMESIDAALLAMISDRNEVSTALNKSVGVLIRDYPDMAEA